MGKYFLANLVDNNLINKKPGFAPGSFVPIGAGADICCMDFYEAGS
jgi:hypothetical protein